MVDLVGLVEIAEAVEVSGYTADYLRRLARDGIVDAQKVAGGWLFNREDLLGYKRTMDALGPRKHGRKETRESV